MNALSPAPVRITPRNSPSLRACSNAALRSSHVFPFSALRTLGRLSVTYAMAPFFSYNTFSSVRPACGVAAAFGGVIVAIELIDVSCLNLSLLIAFSTCESAAVLQKGAESRDCLAHDQILHLVSAFVGVKSFSIREETANVVLGSNAVATQQLACPGHSLAALGRGECLGKRGASIRQLAFGFELSRADHHALRSGDVRQHFGEEVLDELKRADGLAELQTLLAILERILVRAHRAAGCFPPNEITGTF